MLICDSIIYVYHLYFIFCDLIAIPFQHAVVHSQFDSVTDDAGREDLFAEV